MNLCELIKQMFPAHQQCDYAAYFAREEVSILWGAVASWGQPFPVEPEAELPSLPSRCPAFISAGWVFRQWRYHDPHSVLLILCTKNNKALALKEAGNWCNSQCLIEKTLWKCEYCRQTETKTAFKVKIVYIIIMVSLAKKMFLSLVYGKHGMMSEIISQGYNLRNFYITKSLPFIDSRLFFSNHLSHLCFAQEGKVYISLTIPRRRLCPLFINTRQFTLQTLQDTNKSTSSECLPAAPLHRDTPYLQPHNDRCREMFCKHLQRL